eukprot:608091-Prymnesium_polylepis.1
MHLADDARHLLRPRPPRHRRALLPPAASLAGARPPRRPRRRAAVAALGARAHRRPARAWGGAAAQGDRAAAARADRRGRRAGRMCTAGAEALPGLEDEGWGQREATATLEPRAAGRLGGAKRAQPQVRREKCLE